MEMTYHEYYGEVSVEQLRVYKKFNVSRLDHDTLVNFWGEENRSDIIEAVKKYSPGGVFSRRVMFDGERDC